MKPFMRILFVRLLTLATSLYVLPLSQGLALPAADATHTDLIRVDQFGYLPHMVKIAVLADPVAGYNNNQAYTPGESLQVRRASDDALIFSSGAASWKNGQIHSQSGDKVWWFNFSPVNLTGDYYIYDPAANAYSDTFHIGADAYDAAMRDAVRSYFYQRMDQDKTAEWAGENWVDGPAFTQDETARLISAPNDASTERDLRGGWFDAGDYNKYTPWTSNCIIVLLMSYERAPEIWPDNWSLPESGNGIPDILDEVKWGLDWMLKMQLEDGSVLSKNGQSGFNAASPPSSDTSDRFYGAASAYSTLVAAAGYAFAAKVYGDAGLDDYSATLQEAAEKAWTWGNDNLRVGFDNSGFNNANPVPSDSYNLLGSRLQAAIYLFALTQEAEYEELIARYYDTRNPYKWSYWYPFEAHIETALDYYAHLPFADTAIASDIRQNKVLAMNHPEVIPAFESNEDAYRAYLKDNDYTWGSNSSKANKGALYQDMVYYGTDSSKNDIYREAACGFLHYLHGVNPIAMVYLTNMYGAGAERSSNTFYHGWFADKTPWDHVFESTYGPPPGYLVGGPNYQFSPDSSFRGVLEPPQNQPPQKSYRDWNTNWPENSWEVTECSIGYQAAYIHLLAAVMGDKEGYIHASPWKFHPRPDDNPAFDSAAYGQAGMGWINDDGYPFIYAYAAESLYPETPGSGWLYIYPDDASLWGFFAYFFAADTWLWCANTDGYYYNYTLGEWLPWDA